MPVACGDTTVLTGSDGAIYFTPAATQFCLADYSDFPAGTEIIVPTGNDYRISDPIVFIEEGAGNIDSALTPGTTYYVVDKGVSGKHATIKVANTKGGTPITLNGTGGGGAPTGGVPSSLGAFNPVLPTSGARYGNGPYTGIATTAVTGIGTGLTVNVTVSASDVTAIALGTAKGTGYRVGDRIRIDGGLIGGTTGVDDIVCTITAASAVSGGNTTGHINVKFAEAFAVCQVASVNVSFTRGEIDTTSLPCGVQATATGVKLAGFRTYQPGYAEGSGDMTVRFTADNESFANRIIQSSLFTNQGGAVLKVYLNAVADITTGKPDDSRSQLFEGPVSLLGFGFSVTPEDSPTEAQIQFRLSAAPRQLFGLVSAN